MKANIENINECQTIIGNIDRKTWFECNDTDTKAALKEARDLLTQAITEYRHGQEGMGNYHYCLAMDIIEIQALGVAA